MQQNHPFHKNRNCSASVLALLIASAAWSPLSAAELKFEKPADFEKNFAEPTSKGALTVVKEDGGVLRFSSGSSSRIARTAYAPHKKPADLVDEKTTTKFRFNKPYMSFGVMSRVQQEESDCYVALVNIGPNGGILRLFKGQPRGSYADGAVVTKQGPGIKAGEWYRLETSVTNKSTGVVIQAEVKPGNGGRAIFTAEYEDKTNPLNKPGHIQLRFFSSEAGGEVDVKEVSIKPDVK